MICESVNLLFFIKISSFRIPRKFYYQTPLKIGGITVQIVEIFDSLNTRQGPKTRHALLNGALVLLVSGWEYYCEGVCQQAIDIIANKNDLKFVKLPDAMKRRIISYTYNQYEEKDPLCQLIAKLPDDGWRDVLKENFSNYVIEFNTPKFKRSGRKNLNELFKHVLGINMSEAIKSQTGEEDFCDKLDAVVTLRGVIAHTGKPENDNLSSEELRKNVKIFLKAAASIEIIIQKNFMDQLSFSCWNITAQVRENT